MFGNLAKHPDVTLIFQASDRDDKHPIRPPVSIFSDSDKNHLKGRSLHPRSVDFFTQPQQALSPLLYKSLTSELYFHLLVSAKNSGFNCMTFIHKHLTYPSKRGLVFGTREPRDSRIALCKRSAAWGETVLPQHGLVEVAPIAQSLQARPPRGRFLCQPPTHRQGGGLRINSPHGAGFIGGSALHTINRMPTFLADTNNFHQSIELQTISF